MSVSHLISSKPISHLFKTSLLQLILQRFYFLL